QVDVAVGTILGAQSATDAPILDNHFQRAPAPNRPYRAAHHAQRIETLAAGSGHKIMVETQALANQSRYAIMCIRTRAHTGIAASAVIQIEQQKALRLYQALLEEIIERNTSRQGEPLLIHLRAFLLDCFQFLTDIGKLLDHAIEVVRSHSN